MNRSASLAAALSLLCVATTSVPRASAAQPQVRTFYVLPDALGLVGTDGHHHDTFVPTNVVLRKGVAVTFRIVNYDDMPHAMAAPDLGINISVRPARHDTKAKEVSATGNEKAGIPVTPTVTTYTFTPEKTGQFRWHCTVPCDTWSMGAGVDGPGQDGFMAGYIVVMDSASVGS